MFLKAFNALIRDIVAKKITTKYKVQTVNFCQKDANVVCELIGHDKMVTLNLKDIMQSQLIRLFEHKDIIMLSKIFSERYTDNKSSILDTEKKHYSSISIIFTVLLLMSNIAETKIFSFFGYSIGAGTIIFPLLYILSDVITEVYGFKASRKVILIACLCGCLFSLFTYLVYLLPNSEYWQEEEAFEKIFLISPRIMISSVISYFLGEMLNASIIALLKIKWRGRYFILRAMISTLFGSLLESLIFTYGAFWGRLPMQQLLEMIAILTIVKVFYEFLIMPLTIKFISYLKNSEKLDVFEKPSFLFK